MLEIKNLSKRFGDQQVLDHISLKIEKGNSKNLIICQENNNDNIFNNNL